MGVIYQHLITDAHHMRGDGDESCSEADAHIISPHKFIHTKLNTLWVRKMDSMAIYVDYILDQIKGSLSSFYPSYPWKVVVLP